MKQKAILSFCCITLVITTFLTSCDSAGGQVNNNNPEIVRQSASSVTETDINNSASCWLHSLDISFDEWVGDGECTALARFLTKAPGYGKDENGGFLGGADYVIQQEKKGIHIPLLAEIKNDIKPCDNLVLVGPEYVTAGHTVVVFYPDLVNDKIYYLDQNYNGEGVTLRSLSVSKNENSTYVISAECKPDNKELIKCQPDGTQGPLIAAPGPSAPAQPELSTTLVSATVQAPSNNSNASGLHFSGQGPATWSIKKDPGMVIAHVKTKGCVNFMLCGEGQGYDSESFPYDSDTGTQLDCLPIFHNFWYNRFSQVDLWDGSSLIDRPFTDLNEHFIANPNLEVLQIRRIAPDCYWEVDILPVSSARKILPGKVLAGTFSELLAINSNIKSIQFIWTDYDSLNGLSGLFAYTNDGTLIDLMRLDDDDDYFIENLPSDIAYIEINSSNNWELLVE
jgi:hypothetical protein